MMCRFTQVLNIPLLRRSLLYPVPSQNHAAFSGDQAKCLDISWFMFPHRNPTYHYRGSSRAAKHLWARKNYKRSLLYSWNGITEKCIDQQMLDVLSLKTAGRGLLAQQQKVPVLFWSIFLPFLLCPLLWGEGWGRGGNVPTGACVHVLEISC